MDLVAIVVAVLGSGLLTAIVSSVFTRKKISAEAKHTNTDAVQILTNTSVSLLNPMKLQIEFLTGQLERANDQIELLTHTVQALNDKLDKYQTMHGDLPGMIE